MNQCVPNGDPKLSFFKSSTSNSFATDHVPSLELDYEVAELTWENGHLAACGLGTPRVHNKPPGAWEKLPRATDTLESFVDQATALPHMTKSSHANKLVPWLDHSSRGSVSAAAMDALVPCNNTTGIRDNSTQVPGTCMVGSCSGGWARGGRSYASASQSQSGMCGGRDDSQQATLDSCDREFSGGGGLTSTSMWSPENTSSGEDYAKTSGDDHDIVCHSRSQRQAAGDRGNKKLGIGKSSVIAKTRAAAVHNQSERRRRDKINQKMKTLQKLVPNSSKTDKASMLDEVIEYLKQLQAQVQMISRMNMSMPLPLPSMNMMMPLPMQQHLQMSMMASMHGMGMGMGVMDINSIARATGIPPMMPNPAAAFMPMAPSWDVQHPPLAPDFLSNFFASQSQPQPTTMDGYSRLAALYQQFHQSSAGSGPKN